MIRLGRAIGRLGRGDEPPLAAMALALVLTILALVAITIATLAAVLLLDDLKLIVAAELIGDLLKFAVIGLAVFGVLRSIWKATGRPSLWVSAAIAVAIAGVVLLSRGALLRTRENAQILIDRDPVGDPASITLRNGQILFDGNITHGAAARFLALAEKAGPKASLRITSAGGRQFEAEKIADEVARRKMPVYVPDTCESACTDILIASPDGKADVHAGIGFHQATREGARAAENLMINESSRERMQKAGIPADFIDQALSKSADDMWYPTPGELMAAKVVDRLDPRGTLVSHVNWLKDGELPHKMQNWLIVGAEARGSRLEFVFGFTPGSRLWRNPPSADARRSLFAAFFCKDEYYRPLLDYRAKIVMTDVADGTVSEIAAADC